MIKIYPSAKKISDLSLRLLIISAAVIFLARSDEIAQTVRNALSVCAEKVIPALFPYMVISSLIVSSGAAQRIGEHLSFVFSRLFALPGAACAAVILGILCGFPIGAKTACDLYGRGLCTDEQAQRLCSFCNNTGPAFVIGGIGAGFFGSLRTGVVLYCIECISVLVLGCALSLGKDRRILRVPVKTTYHTDLTGAVGSAVTGCLQVCGFVVFFSAIVRMVCSIAQRCTTPLLSTVCACIIEITAGCEKAAGLSGSAGIILASFAIGFGGLCVHAQTLQYLAEYNLSLKKYVFAKTMQGILCAGISALFCFFCKNI